MPLLILKWAIFLIPVSVLFIACGVGGGSENHYAGNGESVSQSGLGIAECYSCHADGAMLLNAGSSQNIFSKWLYGPHGNYEGMYHADNGINNEGFPSFGYNGLGSDPVCTTICHDQTGDGENLAGNYAKSGLTFLGIVNRPVISCESCHGSGDNHYAIGPIPYPIPGADMCGQCHNDQLDQIGTHMTYHPESDNIYADYQASPHATSINNYIYETGSTTDVKALCSKCHTDEGARFYKDTQAGHNQLAVEIPDTDSPIENASAVQCRTCHDAHDPGALLLPEDANASSEYRTCTNCHQYILDINNEDNSYHGPQSPYTWSGYAVGAGTFDSGETIFDTHFDDETTADIEGYVIDPSSSRSCRDCHNQHNADTTIHIDWANSGHGGFILQTTQDPATHKYAVTNSEAKAFVFYDFKANTGGWSGTGQQECQRCHTSTGFRNLADDPAAYDADRDGLPDTLNTFIATGEQREMIYCWACHTSNSGKLRDPGVFADLSPYSAPAARISAVPDLSGSNICMSCHAGSETGQEIKDADFVTEISGKNFGGFNSHYSAFGGILFRTIGYEFDGQDYTNVLAFAHDQIGTTGDPDMGSNGPCVGCHMKTANSHTLLNLTKSGTTVTDITAFNSVCYKCHADKASLITTLNNHYTGYNEALDVITTLLAALPAPVYYGPFYPYFFADPGFTGPFTGWPDKDTLGAAFNLNLLKHLPGAYAHNHVYTQRLIYDTIDFLDDGVINQASVAATLASSPDARAYVGGGPRP